MDIKMKLKEMGIKLFQFAKELDISRPTLDNYIALYEKGEPISTEKYQIIFDNLFDGSITTKDEFIDVLHSFSDMLERDKFLGVKDLSIEQTDLLNKLIELMKDDIEKDDYCKDIYAFVNMLIRSYRDVPTYKRFSNYFLYLNGKKDLSNILDEDKAFYGYCYDLMKKDAENKLGNNSDLYEQFEVRVSEILNKQKKQEEDLTKKVVKEVFDELVRKAIQEKIRQGFDVEDIDIDTLMQSIDLTKLQ